MGLVKPPGSFVDSCHDRPASSFVPKPDGSFVTKTAGSFDDSCQLVSQTRWSFVLKPDGFIDDSYQLVSQANKTACFQTIETDGSSDNRNSWFLIIGLEVILLLIMYSKKRTIPLLK